MGKKDKEMFKIKYRGYDVQSVDQFVYTVNKVLEDSKKT